MIPPDTLKSFTFFSGLNEAEVKSLSIIANEISFQRGEFIFSEDDPARILYLLLDGWVDIVVNMDDRSNRFGLVSTLTPGDLFGWSALVEPHVYTASTVCASPVKAIGFRGVDLRALFEIDPGLCCVITQKVCQVIATRLCTTRLQMVTLFVTD